MQIISLWFGRDLRYSLILANEDLDSFHHYAPSDKSNSNDVAGLPLHLKPAILHDFEDVHPNEETGHHKVESWEVILLSDHEGLASLPRSSFRMMIAESSWLAHYATLLYILLHQIPTSHHHPASLSHSPYSHTVRTRLLYNCLHQGPHCTNLTIHQLPVQVSTHHPHHLQQPGLTATLDLPP